MTAGISDGAKIQVWQALLQAEARVSVALSRDLKVIHNLPLKWYYVLAHLSVNACAGMRLHELALSVDVSQSGLTRMLDRMVEAGLVEREPCPADRRGMVAVITAKGEAMVTEAMPLYLRGIEEHFMRHLDDEEIAALQKICAKVLAAEDAACSWIFPQKLSN